MKTVGMIPIKLNNERLPGKNTMLLGDKPLCSYLFETLGSCKEMDEIYVFCSSEDIVPFIPNNIRFLQRPSVLDNKYVQSQQILSWFLDNVQADVYSLLHVTQPFIKSSTIDACVRSVKTHQYDSAFAARAVYEYMWYQGKPVNYDQTNIVRTQDLLPVLIETEIFVFQREVFLKTNRRIGDNPYIHPIGEREAICVDTYEDFEMAKAVLAIEKGKV